MRDRMIELLKNVPRNTRAFYDQFADYLLANGVIAPPCKIGDVIYRIVNDAQPHITKDYVEKIVNYGNEWAVVLISDRYVLFSEFGESVFINNEQAEQKLKGGESDA